MSNVYTCTITDGDDTVLDTITLDGWDLRRQRDRLEVGHAIAAAMGGTAVAACAALTE